MLGGIDIKELSALRELIEGCLRVVIVVHTHPDGDAVGSALGLKAYLQTLGKETTVIFPDLVPETLDFMLEEEDRAGILTYTQSEKAVRERISQCDLLICEDFNAFSRAGDMERVLSEAKTKKVLIDHHLNPDRESFQVCISTPQVSSASELLFYCLLEMPEIQGDAKKLPKKTATALMTGMTTDTNNFANSVLPSTLKMASMLLDAGVDREQLLSNLYQEYGESRLRSMGYLLYEKLRITPLGVAYMILDKPTIDRFTLAEGDTEGFVNLPLAIGKVKMSIFLKKDNGFFRVSIRSKKGVSANQCAMRYFNGGGHEMAAGGKLFFPKDIASPEEASTYIERVTAEFFKLR